MATASEWARKRLSTLLPLDEDSLSQILTYTSTLPPAEAAEHLKNLLGDSPKALEFISSYNAQRAPLPSSRPVDTTASSGATPERQASPQPPHEATDGVPRSNRRNAKKKAPLHALPSRQIENHGDISGGYKKGQDVDYMAASSKPIPTQVTAAATPSPAVTLSEAPAAQQLPKKLPPSAAGSLISDLPNVKSKSQNSSRTGSPAPKAAKVSITGGTSGKGQSAILNDLDAAIRSLELQTNPSADDTSSKTRSCSCNAILHPLLSAAPNCLNCGKIICLKEGIGPCTYCHKPLLSTSDLHGMLEALKRERGHERQSAHNALHSRPAASSTSPLTSWTSSNPNTRPNAGNNSNVKGKGYEAALAHRDKLLTFQSENAQRTTIHDEAADLTDPYQGVNRWADPTERAQQLRAQQAAMREQEERDRPEWEKRGKAGVIELAVEKGGRVTKTVRKGKPTVQTSTGNGKIVEEQGMDKAGGGNGGEKQTKGKNAPDLRRPLWTPRASSDSERYMTAEEKDMQAKLSGMKSGVWKPGDRGGKWDDNEAVILNGGAYGPAVEEKNVGTETSCG